MNEQPQTNMTLAHVKCPKCNSTDYSIIGTKGSTLRSYGGALFSGIGNLVNGQKNHVEFKPLKLKCSSCHNKYEGIPEEATADEKLTEPATIQVTRHKRVVGMAVKYHVVLNGLNYGAISNGRTVSIQTNVKDNVLVLLDMNGAAPRNFEHFDVSEAEVKEIDFKVKTRLI